MEMIDDRLDGQQTEQHTDMDMDTISGQLLKQLRHFDQIYLKDELLQEKLKSTKTITDINRRKYNITLQNNLINNKLDGIIEHVNERREELLTPLALEYDSLNRNLSDLERAVEANMTHSRIFDTLIQNECTLQKVIEMKTEMTELEEALMTLSDKLKDESMLNSFICFEHQSKKLEVAIMEFGELKPLISYEDLKLVTTTDSGNIARNVVFCPRALAVCPSTDRLYFLISASGGNAAIYQYDSKWMYKGRFNVDSFPDDLTVDNKGRIIVVNYMRDEVKIYNNCFHPVNAFSCQEVKKDEVYSAYNVACDGEDNIYVLDGTDGRIRIFDRDGNLLREIMNSLLEGFSRSLLIRSSRDEILVTRYNHSMVSVFDFQGEHVRNVGENYGPGKLEQPRSTCCDNVGNVLVTDTGTNQIQVYTADYEYLCTVKNDTDVLNDPCSIVVSASDFLVVTDISAKKVYTLSSI